MRYLVYRQAGRVTLLSEVDKHTYMCLYIIHTFLPLYTDKHRSPALAISSMLLLFRAPQRLQVGHSSWARLLADRDRLPSRDASLQTDLSH